MALRWIRQQSFGIFPHDQILDLLVESDVTSNKINLTDIFTFFYILHLWEICREWTSLLPNNFKLFSDVTENDIFSHWHCAYLDNILRDEGAGKYIIYTNLPNCLSICNECQTFLTPEREQNASD